MLKILVIIAIVVIYHIHKMNKEQEEREAAEMAAKYALNPSDPATVALIDEAVSIINDMLEVGSAARLFSDEDYEGAIFALPASSQPNHGTVYNYSLQVTMLDVSNLANCRHKYPKHENNPNWQPYYSQLDRFIWKYSNNYNTTQKRYIVRTKNTIPLLTNDKDKLNDLLYKEVERRCSLAELRGTVIRTKNVAY